VDQGIQSKAHDIKLVFFDVDGTLLGRDGRYSKSLQKQLRRIQAMGIKTAIASGRPPFACQFLFDELGLDACGLFYTGGMIFDPSNQSCIHESRLNKADLTPLLALIRQKQVYCELYAGQQHFVEEACDVSVAHGEHLRVQPERVQFETLMNDKQCSVQKLLIGVDETQAAGCLQELESHFPQFQFAYARFPAKPNWLFASVIAAEADKTEAFARLIEHHQVTAEQVMAFGDAGSDIAFLRLAGLGVAMGNAEAHVQAAADWVSLSVDEDGVAHALKLLIPEL